MVTYRKGGFFVSEFQPMVSFLEAETPKWTGRRGQSCLESKGAVQERKADVLSKAPRHSQKFALLIPNVASNPAKLTGRIKGSTVHVTWLLVPLCPLLSAFPLAASAHAGLLLSVQPLVAVGLWLRGTHPVPDNPITGCLTPQVFAGNYSL